MEVVPVKLHDINLECIIGNTHTICYDIIGIYFMLFRIKIIYDLDEQVVSEEA